MILLIAVISVWAVIWARNEDRKWDERHEKENPNYWD
jgi:hypothetical protein